MPLFTPPLFEQSALLAQSVKQERRLKCLQPPTLPALQGGKLKAGVCKRLLLLLLLLR